MKKETKAPKKEAKKEAEKKYLFEISFNGENYTEKTDDIYQTLLTMEHPAILKTEVIIKVTSGKRTTERVLNVTNARRVFMNTTAALLLSNSLTKFVA